MKEFIVKHKGKKIGSFITDCDCPEEYIDGIHSVVDIEEV